MNMNALFRFLCQKKVIKSKLAIMVPNYRKNRKQHHILQYPITHIFTEFNEYESIIDEFSL